MKYILCLYLLPYIHKFFFKNRKFFIPYFYIHSNICVCITSHLNQKIISMIILLWLDIVLFYRPYYAYYKALLLKPNGMKLCVRIFPFCLQRFNITLLLHGSFCANNTSLCFLIHSLQFCFPIMLCLFVITSAIYISGGK